MFGVFKAVQELVPVTKPVNEIQSEGFINRLHYRVTCGALLACSLLVTCLEWIGNGHNISCVMEGHEEDWLIPPNVINTYCYIMTTFTVPKHYNEKMKEETAYYGVGAYNPKKDDVSYKAYYQWVPFVLFLQAIMFHFPHLVFKVWEGGKIKNIMSGLNRLILCKHERIMSEKVLVEYLVESRNTHNAWALKMLFIDVLNLVNAVGNIFFIDVFLGGEFRTYGREAIDFLNADPELRIDPMSKVFPRMTKCTYRKFGPSGTVQHHDAVCVLPINIVNEKIYVFLWIWLIFLSAVTFIGLVYHIIVMASPSVNKAILKSRALNQKNIHLDDIGEKFEIGDWKLLMILAKNMEPLVLGELLKELYHRIKEINQTGASTPLVSDIENKS